MRRDAKIARLQEVPMFRACGRKELDEIARAGDELDLAAGAVIVSEGDTGHEFFVLLDGSATVERGGREVAVLGEGAWFGELSLLDGQRRDATVTAKEPVSLLVIGERQFSALLADVPSLSRKLMAGMARRLHELDARG